jgi:hypothetical protein
MNISIGYTTEIQQPYNYIRKSRLREDKGLCRCRGALIVATWASYPWLKYDNMNIEHKKQSDMDSTTRRDTDLTISSHVFVLCESL